MQKKFQMDYMEKETVRKIQTEPIMLLYYYIIKRE